MIELLAILLGLFAEAGSPISKQSSGPSLGNPNPFNVGGLLPPGQGTLANNFNLPNSSFGKGFVSVPNPSPSPAAAPLVLSQVYAQQVVTNQTVQTPQGPVTGVTIVGNPNNIIGLAPTPAGQQAVTAVFSKVNQQLRGHL